MSPWGAIAQLAALQHPDDSPDSYSSREHFRRWGRDILLRAEPAQAARLLEMWGDAPPIDPTQLNLPTLIIRGALDAIIPLEHVRELERQTPQSELLSLDGAGHVPTLTCARQVVDAIERFFPATTRLI